MSNASVVLDQDPMQPPALKSDRHGVRSRAPSLGRIPSRATVATHRALYADPSESRCDLCDAVVAKDEAGGSGLYVWTRGEEVRYEEPPLCKSCGDGIAVVATRRWEEEEEEEG